MVRPVYESLSGLSILVHAGEDDFVTQPSGNSGARVGCGVIQPAR
jgi:Cu-Zn family superoxide dismutase